MIVPTLLTNTSSIALEKERLRKAIAAQERVVLGCMEKAKQETTQELSPINLIKNGIGTLFSLHALRKNPISSFQIGYKLVSFLVKKIKTRKKIS